MKTIKEIYKTELCKNTNTQTIKEILMDRDELSAENADMVIADAKEQLEEYFDRGDFSAAYNICEEFFGLEPDYITELIDI